MTQYTPYFDRILSLMEEEESALLRAEIRLRALGRGILLSHPENHIPISELCTEKNQ